MLPLLINTDSFLFVYIIIPLLIFLARIMDVSIGTVRIVFVSKGLKILAPILGFFEILIWLIAMSKIFENLDNWVYYVAYAGGFAMGNYIGLLIEQRMAIGYVNVRIVTKLSGANLIESLVSKGYGITNMEAQGAKAAVNVILCVIKRKELSKIIAIVKQHNPKAFYTIEDIRFVNMSYLPSKTSRKRRLIPLRKGK